MSKDEDNKVSWMSRCGDRAGRTSAARGGKRAAVAKETFREGSKKHCKLITCVVSAFQAAVDLAMQSFMRLDALIRE